MNIETKIYLRMMAKLLVQFMQIANQIDEEEFRQVVNKARTKKAQIKGILDNAGRGNLFMVAFFLREMIESILNE